MNKLVNELAEQAESMVSWGDPNNHDERSRAFNEWQEKFAELIVRECVAQNQIAIQSLKDRPEDILGWKTMMNLTQVTCQNQIAEHFGVDL